MKIKHKLPPNYDKIIEHIPAVEGMKGVVFTYGDVLYVPNGQDIPSDLMKHEETHVVQQMDIGVDEWWDKYLTNPNFRIRQEVEAYQAQYAYVIENYNRAGRRAILQRIAKDLSRPMYGSLVTKEEAARLITE